MAKYTRKRNGPRLCSYPGCMVVVPGGGRCSQHLRSFEMTEQQRASKKFLNSRAWKLCRAVKLAKDPWCERCAAIGKQQPVPAVHVHHIKPRETYPELSLTMSNLMSTCISCHTIIEKSGGDSPEFLLGSPGI